mgnify:CR=1 FL=1
MNAEHDIFPPVGREVAAVALEAIVRDHMPDSVRGALDPARVLEQFEAMRLDSLDQLSFHRPVARTAWRRETRRSRRGAFRLA